MSAYTDGYEDGRNNGMASGWREAVLTVTNYLKQEDEALLAEQIRKLFIPGKED